MKLKTQEKIRLLELLSVIGIYGLDSYLEQCSGASLARDISYFLSSNGVSLEGAFDVSKNIYMFDVYTSFRTQKITEEYRELRDLYKEFLSNVSKFFVDLGIADSPIKIFAVYVYMYRSGYLSYGNNFEYSVDMKDFSGLTGIDVIRGTGVCRSISAMLTDVYRTLGYQSYNLSVKASDESIAKLQKISNVSLQTSDKGSKFAKIVGKVTKRLPIANHLITMVSDGDKNYIFDPTNDGFLRKDLKNNIVTFSDFNVGMKNYFWESFLVNVLGMYSDGLNLKKQKEQLNMATVSDFRYRFEYLNASLLCMENEDLFIEFYERNRMLIERIYSISYNQNGIVRRLIPVIPKRMNK